MEHISIQLDSAIARQVEKGMREFNYTTKTEFIRDAIRAKLKEMDEERAKKKAWAALFAAKGIFKGKVPVLTEEEERNLEEKIDLKIRKDCEKKFGIKLT